MAVGVERRLGQASVVDAVGRPPGEIHPVGAGFQDVVGVVEVVDEDQAGLITALREFAQPVELVLVARNSIAGKKFDDVEKDFLTTLRRAGLLKPA